MKEQTIPAWLESASYEKLFLQGEAAQILSHSGVEAELSAIVAASNVKPKLRVLAHELLIEAGRPLRPETAESYCQMLPSGFQHNWWGMPGHYLERLGRTMVAFGQSAVPCLVRLLTNQQPLGYFGSEEPTLSQAMHYRVKDLAAYLIATVIHAPFTNAKEVRVRDEFIAQLRDRLARSPA